MPDPRLLSSEKQELRRAMKKRRAGGQRIQKVLASIASGIEQPSSVIVSQGGWRAGPPKQQQGFQHLFQHFLELTRHPEIVEASQDRSVQKEIERVDVITSRSLKMETVGLDLTARLLQDNFPATQFPLFRSRQLRAQRPQKQERDGLSQQVRIR